MPELDYGLICDYVRAEGGIAHVISAGIDTIWANEVPAGQNIGLLMRFTFTRNECGREHRIEVIFQDADGERLAQIAAAVTPQWNQELPAGWRAGVLMGLNVGVPLPAYGLYSLEIMLNDSQVKTIPLRVAPPVQTPG